MQSWKVFRSGTCRNWASCQPCNCLRPQLSCLFLSFLNHFYRWANLLSFLHSPSLSLQSFNLLSMLSSLPVVFLLSVALRALAAPQPSPTPLGQSIPLTRRPKVARSIDDWSEWAKNQREAVRAKYTIDAPSTGQLQKRGSGTNL